MRDRRLDLFWCLDGVRILGLRPGLRAELCELLPYMWRATESASGSSKLRALKYALGLSTELHGVRLWKAKLAPIGTVLMTTAPTPRP